MKKEGLRKFNSRRNKISKYRYVVYTDNLLITNAR